MGERLVGYCLPVPANRDDRALQIDRVPEHDGGNHEVQPTCAMPLVLVRAIPQFAQPVEEHRPCQGVSRLALIQPDVDAAAQFDAADVLEQEQRPFNLAEFSQRYGQPILTWVGAKFAQHQRCRHRAMLDRRGEAEDFVPVAADPFPIRNSAYERCERRIAGRLRGFVWQPEQICTLFDSLMQGYPFGTFLYWKVEQENNKNYQFYDFVRDYHEKDNPHCPRLGELPNRDVTAVLDGQQRLTALNIGLRGSMAKKLPWKRRSNPDAYPQKHLYVDLLWTPDDEDDVGMKFRFEFRTPAEIGNGKSCWFVVKDIMRLSDSGPAMTEWLENRLPGVPIAPAHKVLHRLYTVIRERPVVCFYEEPSQELEKVLQIFIRTNSGGTVLSYSDLLLSVAVAQWSKYDAREVIHQLVDDLNKIGNGFTLSKDWVLKAGLMLGDIGSVGFKVENFNRDNMATLEGQWPRIKRALTITIELASNFGFKAETLGADSALLPIAYYLYVTEADNGYLTKSHFSSGRSSIRKWLVSSLLKTGIWGSGLDSLLTALRQVSRLSWKWRTAFRR